MPNDVPCPSCSHAMKKLEETQRTIWRQLKILDAVSLRRGSDTVSWLARESLRNLVPENIRNEPTEEP